MLVTIIADASFDAPTHIGGYGFWAISRRKRHAGGGAFKATVACSEVAEMAAIVNAMHQALKLGIACKGDHILVQTDCLMAIRYLDRRTRKIPPAMLTVTETFEQTCAEHELLVRFKHVRGHTSVQDQRSKAQRHSDARAKTAMRAARAKVQGVPA